MSITLPMLPSAFCDLMIFSDSSLYQSCWPKNLKPLARLMRSTP